MYLLKSLQCMHALHDNQELSFVIVQTLDIFECYFIHDFKVV